MTRPVGRGLYPPLLGADIPVLVFVLFLFCFVVFCLVYFVVCVVYPFIARQLIFDLLTARSRPSFPWSKKKALYFLPNWFLIGVRSRLSIRLPRAFARLNAPVWFYSPASGGGGSLSSRSPVFLISLFARGSILSTTLLQYISEGRPSLACRDRKIHDFRGHMLPLFVFFWRCFPFRCYARGCPHV